MRKTNALFFSLAFFAATAALVGCQKNASLPTLQQQLEGKWTLQSAIGHYVVNGNARRDATQFTTNDYFQFNADGTLSIREGATTTSGQWKIENNKLVISQTNYIDYPSGFAVSEITNSKLQLSYREQNQFSTLEQELNLAK